MIIPHLIRTHFINSFNGPIYSSLDIEGGTSLSARNGEGKTSYASATLLFFGSSPASISRVGSGKAVAPFFFPAANSWIIHEYLRPSGKPALAAFYSEDQSLLGVVLIDAAFESPLFLNEAQEARDIHQLIPYLDETGVMHSPRITALHLYRAYLFSAADAQYRDNVTQTQRRIFGVASEGRSMDQIHRVCAAIMDMGRNSFRPVQDLICQRIESMSGIIVNTALGTGIAETQALYQHIQAVAALAPSAHALVEATAQMEALVGTRQSIAAAAQQRLQAAREKIPVLAESKRSTALAYEAERQRSGSARARACEQPWLLP